jgi:hypothetical protein
MEFSKNNSLVSYLFSDSGQNPLLGIPHVYTSKEHKRPQTFNKKVISSIKEKIAAKKQVSVILAARWISYVGKDPISVKDKSSYLDDAKTHEGSLKILEAGLQRTLKELKSLGVHKTLIVLPYPEFKYDVLKCFKKSECDTTMESFNFYRKEILRSFQNVVKNFPDVRLLDPAEVVCREDRCPQIIDLKDGGRIPVVYDDDHASVAAAQLIGREKTQDLKWLIDPDPVID